MTTIDFAAEATIGTNVFDVPDNLTDEEKAIWAAERFWADVQDWVATGYRPVVTVRVYDEWRSERDEPHIVVDLETESTNK